MSFSKKLNKLTRDPKIFFYDMKIFKKKVELKKKVESSVIGKIHMFDDELKVLYFKKKVINATLGYSTLYITDDSEDYLINKRIIGQIIRNKDFIAFREKSIYYILEKDFRKNHIYNLSNMHNLVLKNKDLKSNLFLEFRNIVVHNPLTESFVFVRNTNSYLKTICIVDSIKSLNFIKNYVRYIDVLITLNHFDLSEFTCIPRIIKIEIDNKNFRVGKNMSYVHTFINSYNEVINEIDENIVNSLKIALIDTSYKKDANLLLPVISHISNLSNIDEYNNNTTIQGLIKYNYKNVRRSDNFTDIIDKIVIEELYLRDNLYSIYKDLILQAINTKDYKRLLIKTLEDGVNYEEI